MGTIDSHKELTSGCGKTSSVLMRSNHFSHVRRELTQDRRLVEKVTNQQQSRVGGSRVFLIFWCLTKQCQQCRAIGARFERVGFGRSAHGDAFGDRLTRAQLRYPQLGSIFNYLMLVYS